MSAEDKIKSSLAWRGPSGKPMGHVVVTREQGEELLREIERYRCNDEHQMQRAINADAIARELMQRAISAERALAELKAAAEKVSWFDWSDNDSDAIESIDMLRRLIK
jgi:hypothetical protein